MVLVPCLLPLPCCFVGFVLFPLRSSVDEDTKEKLCEFASRNLRAHYHNFEGDMASATFAVMVFFATANFPAHTQCQTQSTVPRAQGREYIHMYERGAARDSVRTIRSSSAHERPARHTHVYAI